MDKAKRHHFVPAFLLARWADDGTRHGRLWALHRDKDKPVPTTPDDCAVERHFNRIQAEGLDPNVVEDGYAELEGHSVPVVTRIVSNLCVPRGQDRADFLYFVAHQITRVHYGRNLVNQVGTQMARGLMDFVLHDKRIWNAMVDDAHEGTTKPERSFEEFKEIWQRGITLKVNPNLQIAQSLESANTVYDELIKRPWSLLSPLGSGKFIISDNPVARYRVGPQQGRYDHLYGPNFDIFMPLSPTLAIFSGISRGEGACELLDEPSIARFNTRIMKAAKRHVYSSDPDLVWWNDSQNRVGDWADYVRFRSV